VEAFRRAMLAGDRAVVTGVDTALILFVWHIRLVIALTCSFGLERELGRVPIRSLRPLCTVSDHARAAA
jgi:hypothetical protein